ncbi:hypothetical protein G6F66_015010 [Rhizopus arrhizus]|nr:hypothetical protein G6F66_015010 [Rhizopus arrhizus]
MPLDGGLHRVQVDAGARMGGYFQRFQPQPLQRLQGAIERGRFHDDGVARMRARLQAQVHGRQRAVGHADCGGGPVDGAEAHPAEVRSR